MGIRLHRDFCIFYILGYMDHIRIGNTTSITPFSLSDSLDSISFAVSSMSSRLTL